MPEPETRQWIDRVLFASYLVFLISLICALRAVNSMSVGLLLIFGLWKMRIDRQQRSLTGVRGFFVVACCGYALLQFAGLLYTHNPHEEWKHIRAMSALVLLPLGMCCNDYLTVHRRDMILKWYTATLCLAALFAIFRAIERYRVLRDSRVFVYHSLVSLYSAHAIQFSILVAIAIVYLVEAARRQQIVFTRTAHLLMVLFLTVFLFLLSSKLVIACLLVYAVCLLITFFRKRVFAKTFLGLWIAGLLLLCAGIFLTANPISSRFREIEGSNLSYLHSNSFTPGEYFNGLQFRLLQWRYVPEILIERRAWPLGLSPGDAQAALNEKYISMNMYTGTGMAGDRGFLDYNTHNQFLEALLQSGIAGLAAFMLIAGILIRMMCSGGSAPSIFVTSLLLLYCFTESVFESQYSLFIFLFFPLFFLLADIKKPT
jgi:O-antigen ligase